MYGLINCYTKFKHEEIVFKAGYKKNLNWDQEDSGNENSAEMLTPARELYRPRDRRLSPKLLVTFADREVSRSLV
jgi:hypothetical protein